MMAWIRTISEDDAEGLLAKLYEAARARAGRVANIVKTQSLNVRALRAGAMLYHETTLADSPLSRAQREMVAVVVSRTNACHY
jgi:alkylhydroperoxidase family enzyme